METSDAEADLRAALRYQGLEIERIDGTSAVEAMTQFYLDRRADDVDLDHDGDMLLFQWGTYDWGRGPSFQYNIARQFITSSGDDEDFLQLSITTHFDATDTALRLGRGDQWCRRPEDVTDFLAVVKDHPASAYVAQLQGILAWEAYSRLPQLKVPTLVIHGENDRLVPLGNGQQIAARIPGARLVMLPHASHIFPTDQSAACHFAILEFLATV